ncbi:MAG: methylthioribulose 1-phosphate dehydratase [Deltaproteobacteria bacterium]|nr:methylthioribulose 1-phosphate dehydratase [Deltaproteobacteria bacterium]
MADIRSELCKTAQYFHQKGWMMGTAGNLSARETHNNFWITASGQSKGSLTTEQLLNINMDGTLIKQNTEYKPSAETSIHIAAYTLFPTIRSCLHVHMVEGNWICDDHPQSDWIALPHLEMLKGFGWKEGPAHILVTKNHDHVPNIALDMMYQYNQPQKSFTIPGFLIRGHGVTAWGSSIEEARNRVELLSFIFSYMCR